MGIRAKIQSIQLHRYHVETFTAKVIMHDGLTLLGLFLVSISIESTMKLREAVFDVVFESLAHYYS